MIGKKTGPKGPHVWTYAKIKEFAGYLHAGKSYKEIGALMGKNGLSIKQTRYKYASLIETEIEKLKKHDALHDMIRKLPDVKPLIDISKQYRTAKDDEVIIYSVNGGGKYPVHGAIQHHDRWVMTCWTEFGGNINSGDNETLFDLVEVKPRIKRTVWFNVYPKPQGLTAGCSSKEQADAMQVGNRIACVKVEIDCEEGEGL